MVGTTWWKKEMSCIACWLADWLLDWLFQWLIGHWHWLAKIDWLITWEFWLIGRLIDWQPLIYLLTGFGGDVYRLIDSMIEWVSDLFVYPFTPMANKHQLCSFSWQYHPWIQHWGHENRGNVCRLEKLLNKMYSEQYGEPCILMLRCKGINTEFVNSLNNWLIYWRINWLPDSKTDLLIDPNNNINKTFCWI